ncbi:DUF5643 domain-containing protein [Paenibacillus sp. N3/727]|uniref:DUF5643 domain-containing protein n=1 Tax=Paenibacillus sp. N3/727 TaxID=2925845 RepID=UPI001F536F7C|nr:DUF5643 domain-containing protein [Paenibacillus sp. N3/727]UNK16284.1 DUF5643 domain-containing protein [Paenibacillus sp. N3/727]
MISTKSNYIRNKIALTALIVALGMTVIGSGFPTYVSADTSKQAAGASYIAAAMKGIKHSGVTFSLPKVMYDGNRLDITVRQEGGTMDPLNFPVLSVDGKEMMFSTSITTSEGSNTALISYSINGKQQLSDNFNMTLKLYAKNVKEPFIFNVPVKKLDSLVTLQPGTTKKSGDFSYTVDYFEMTPLMMKLKVNSQGKVPAVAKSKGLSSKMFYDIVDEKGNIKEVTVSDIDVKSKPGSNSKEDLSYASSFKAVPKIITIKPFTYTIDTKGEIMKDSSGRKWAKTYYKNLEMKITMK